MSAEHLWPQWIERLNPKYKGRYAFQTGGGATGKATLSWVKRSIDMKAHVVCEPCNNTWMSDVDEEARGTMKDMILHSAHVTLLPRGIKSIAAFAFKTSAIADSIDDHYSKPFFSYSDCKGFSAPRSPHAVPGYDRLPA